MLSRAGFPAVCDGRLVWATPAASAMEGMECRVHHRDSTVMMLMLEAGERRLFRP
jgi:hypothetical protein